MNPKQPSNSRATALALLVAWLVVSATGCRAQPPRLVRVYEARGAMGTYVAITVFAPSEALGRKAIEAAFARVAARLHYEVQAALYTDAMTALLGGEWQWLWVVAERDVPHRVEVYQAGDDILERGRDRYQDVLRRLADTAHTAPEAIERSFTQYEPAPLSWPRWDS